MAKKSYTTERDEDGVIIYTRRKVITKVVITIDIGV